MSSADFCIVCADPLEYCAFGPCGHKETCSKCVLRLRTVLKNNKCVVCQQEQSKVFVTRFAGDYTASLSADAFANLEVSTPSNRTLKQAQAFFADSRHCDQLRQLCSFSHPLVGSCSSLKALKQELKKRHGAEFCNVCLEGRKVFISEQIVYSPKELKTHMKQGDDEGPMARAVGFKGHPPCHYCDQRFYGENEIFEHMTRVHEECFICKRRNPHKHVYYEDYSALEQHFKDHHYLCQNQDCLDQKFVVFSTEQELKTHVVREHGGNMTKAEKKQALTVETGFTTGDRRGSGRDGRDGRDGRVGLINQRGAGSSGTASQPTNYLSQERRQDVVIIGGDANMPSRGSSRGPSRNASSTNLSAEVEDRMARAQISERERQANTQFRPAASASTTTNLASEAEFPSMAASNGAPTVAGRWAGASAPHHQKKMSGNAAEDFPALGGGSRPPSSTSTRSLASVVGKKGQTRVINTAPSHDRDAFPALAPSTARARDLRQAPMSSSLRRATNSLAQKMKKRLGMSAYQDLKEKSTLWMAGDIPTVEFHELIVSLGVANLVPEIAATCTNPVVREELLDAHSSFRFADTASPGSAKNWVPPEVAALSRSTMSRSGGVWNCSVCTLLNSELNKTCEACGSLRTNDAAVRRESPAPEAFPSLGNGVSSTNAPNAPNIPNTKGKKGKKVGLADLYGLPPSGLGQGSSSSERRPHPQNPWMNANLRR